MPGVLCSQPQGSWGGNDGGIVWWHDGWEERDRLGPFALCLLPGFIETQRDLRAERPANAW